MGEKQECLVLCCVGIGKKKKRKTVRCDIDGNICTDACRGGRGGALNTSNSFKVCLPARLHLHIQRVKRASPANQQPVSTRQTHSNGNSKEGNSLLYFIILICFLPPPRPPACASPDMSSARAHVYVGRTDTCQQSGRPTG